MDKSNAPKGQDNTPNHTNDSQNSGALGNAPPRVSSDPPPPPEHGNPNRNSGQPPWWRRLAVWTFIGEIVLVAITLRIACIYSGQLNQMIKANNLTQNALHDAENNFAVDQRPWVGIESNSFTAKSNKKPAEWEVSFYTKNFGKSPAKRVFVDYKILTGDIESTWNIDSNPTRNCDIARAGSTNPSEKWSVIFPGDRIPFSRLATTASPNPVSEADVIAARKRWIYVCIAYQGDALDDVKSTKTLFSIEKNEVFQTTNY